MTNEADPDRGSQSYRSIVRSTGIIGGSQFGVLLLGLVRAKAFALLAGPAGIGLFGLYSSIVANGAAVAGMGLNTSAVREIANPSVDQRTSERAVWTLTLLLGSTGGLALFLLRKPVSQAIAGDSSLEGPAGWLGIAVALTVFMTAISATLQGHRRLGDLARSNLLGTAIGSIAGIALLVALGEPGLLAAAIAAPLAQVVVGFIFWRRIPRPAGPVPRARDVVADWNTMLKLGSGVLATTIIGSATQLALRAIVLQELGLGSVGLFQAAAAITTLNVALVLSAMAADYYPRLSRAADDSSAMSRLLDQQLHVAVLLAAPVLLGLSGGAALLLQLLYSDEFAPGADVLRWLVVADSLRVASWALGFVLLARRDTIAYVIPEASFSIVALPSAWLLSQHLGLSGVGIGFALGYVATVVSTGILVWRRHRVAAGPTSLTATTILVSPLLLLALLGEAYPRLATGFGLTAALGAAAYALIRLHREDALPRPLQRAAARLLKRSP